jgi:hypothetical protein
MARLERLSGRRPDAQVTERRAHMAAAFFVGREKSKLECAFTGSAHGLELGRNNHRFLFGNGIQSGLVDMQMGHHQLARQAAEPAIE